MRILTGVQPSGKLHLGNYFSVIKKILNYQNSDTIELYCFIANLHAITTWKSKEELKKNTIDAVCDFLALGLDPNKSVFWIQSDVHEIVELSWYLSSCITVSQLNLAHSFKDKISKGFSPSGALFFYPVLMAADILGFDADVVPVGKDQKQHLEFARDIAIKFNHIYGPVLKIPEVQIDEGTALVPGTDGLKMSKSYGNTINFFDDEKKIQKSVMSIITDSSGVFDVKEPEKNNLYNIFSLFLNEIEKEKLKERFQNPGLQYGVIKKELLEKILEHFSTFRQKRELISKDTSYIQDVIKNGSQKARKTIAPIIDRIRNNIGIR